MKIAIMISSIVICSSQLLFASSRPKWTSEPPKGYLNDFFVGIGESSVSEADAIQRARANGVQEALESRRINITVNDQMINVSQESIGGVQNYQSTTNQGSKITIQGNETIQNLFEEENYVEYVNGLYTAWSLVKIPKLRPSPEEIPTSSDYLVRSFVPGWAQYYKGQPIKGFTIIAGEGAALAGGIYYESLSASYSNSAAMARTQSDQNYYNNMSDNASLTGTIFLVGAALIYVYNVIDGIASEPEKVYVENGIGLDNHYAFVLSRTQTIISLKVDF